MDKVAAIEKTREHVRHAMQGMDSGHDHFHVERVWRTARQIAEEEKADLFVVEMAALLHDIADWKFHGEDAGTTKAREWMSTLDLDEETVEKVIEIIDGVTFKGAAEKAKHLSLEGNVVQDADRLDALGALGISRVFSFAGFKGNPIHDPAAEPQHNMNFEQYKKNKSTAINHFHEKLLLIKDRMNTDTAKKMAEGRHTYMEEYLDRFFKEWNGEL
jgi:uncharacterized protein